MLRRRLNILGALYILTFGTITASGMGHPGDGKKDDFSTDSTAALGPTGSSLAINTYRYTTAVGIRGLGTSGLTVKHFTTSTNAIEGILGLWPDAFSATVLFERHTNAFDEAGLNWYYGVGGHIATQSDWVYHDGYRTYERVDGEFGFGVDGIFGIEYKINEVPIAVSLDVKPFLEVTTQGHAYLAIDPGLGVKVTF